MGIKSVVIARNIESDNFWKKKFNSEEEAIEFKNTLANRNYNEHKIVGLIKEERSGHRWCLCIKKPKKEGEKEIMFFNSKKSCILAARLIKDYDNDLKITCTKKY